MAADSRSQRRTRPSAFRRWLWPDALGADPSGERLARIRESPQFRAGAFRNAPAQATPPAGGAVALLRDVLRRRDWPGRRPAGPLPVHTALPPAAPDSGLRVTWLGHATALAEIDGHRVLFDPVWSPRCSPFGFAGPRRFHPPPVPLSALAPLDAVVISHDHYDHLDMATTRALAGMDTRFVVPLGVGAHLEHWGVPPGRVTELDWSEATRIGDLTLTATPGRHFCGRGLRRRALSLWASWVAAGPRHRVFHSGDTGYFDGFSRIGGEHGPFDLTLMQVGAYSGYWPDIHMTPEEGLRAHHDLGGGVLLPIHWGTFNLALHPWQEPVERLLTAARAAEVPLALPRPGQSWEPDAAPLDEPWWRTVPGGAEAAPGPAASTRGAARREPKARPARSPDPASGPSTLNQGQS